MRSMRALRTGLAVALAAVLTVPAVSACSSTPPVFVAPSHAPTPTPTYASPTPTPGPSDATSATALLLATDQVGKTYTPQALQPTTSGPPCAPKGTPPLNTQVPPTISVGRTFTQASPLAVVSEELDVYSDVVGARHALALARTGFTCRRGTAHNTGGSAVEISLIGPSNFLPQLGGRADEAYAWSLGNDNLQGSVVVVRMGRQLLIFTFAAGTNVPARELPSPPTIVVRGVAKVRAGL